MSDEPRRCLLWQGFSQQVLVTAEGLAKLANLVHAANFTGQEN